MKKNCFFFFILLSFAATAIAAKVAVSSKGIDNFERYEEGIFPTYFKSWPFQRGKAQQIYKIKSEEGNKFLSAFDDKNLSTQIYKDYPGNWDTNIFPYFKWRWRATKLPAGAKESNPATNDSACGVYILFGKTTGTALKFAWSSTMPVGSVYEKKPGKMAIHILDSGSGALHQWRWHSVPIPEMYEKLLKQKMLRQPTGFAVLTDGNAVKKPAGCDYDDFHISATP